MTDNAAARPVAVYFHGVPGAPLESARFATAARQAEVRLVAVDRQLISPDLSGEPYFAALAGEVESISAGAPVHLIGFSVGAFVAIRTAIHLKVPIRQLHLISAAAPLDGSDFLDGMAGKAVFSAAARGPASLRSLIRVQSWMAEWMPGLMMRMLFAGAAGADRALASDKSFRREIRDVLRLSLEGGATGYARDLTAYVQPWRNRLAEVAVDTAIWHGAADTWAPVAMAQMLKDGLPTATHLTIWDGLSHYSCLFRAIPQILSEIGRSAEETLA
jgi:pimeloyl-ACP methyl ester carboxylesterase